MATVNTESKLWTYFLVTVFSIILGALYLLNPDEQSFRRYMHRVIERTQEESIEYVIDYQDYYILSMAQVTFTNADNLCLQYVGFSATWFSLGGGKAM